MPDLRLLLLVNVTIAPEHLEKFTLYYNDHIPTSLTIPGYLWGQRYVSLSDPARFLALYQVRSPEDLETMLDWKSPRLHPTARSEFAMWQRLPGMSNSITNVYEQIMGTPLDEPLLRSDRPISMVMADVDPAHEEEWNRWYTDSHVPNLLKIPGYAMAGRFRTLGHPVTNNFNSGPRYLAPLRVRERRGDSLPGRWRTDAPSGPRGVPELEAHRRSPHPELLMGILQNDLQALQVAGDVDSSHIECFPV